MGSELVSVPVASGMVVAAGAGIAYASAHARASLDERRIPLLGIMGAFVFAAQMVNFPVLPGTSGHFVGGALLAIVLGPHAAVLGMSAIVIVQCLVYQDGGLLALGANLFNMAVVGPYAAWMCYRAIRGSSETISRARLYGASFASAFASVFFGSLLVPLEVAASGVNTVPLLTFVGWMGAVHALIGLAEGGVTFAVLLGLRSLKPDLVPAVDDAPRAVPAGTVAVSVLVSALVVGGFLSLLASESPDGLESTLEHLSVVDHSAVTSAAGSMDGAVAHIALLGDYSGPGGGWYWTTVSGILGVVLMVGIGTALGRLLGRASAAGSRA